MNVDLKDKNLLYGILALQNNLITQDQLLNAFRELSNAPKSADKNSLRDILVSQGALDRPFQSAIDALVEAHLQKNGFDSKASLNSVEALDFSLHEELTQIDPQLESSLLPLSDDKFNGDKFNGDNVTISASYGRPTASGRFQILRPHAKGGLGEVYVALDQELDREVALKQIRGDSLPLEKKERFVREAEITGKLEHPGVVPVYGMGTDTDGNPYYAMRLIRGQSLRSAIKKYHKLEKSPARDRSEQNKDFRRLLQCFIDVCNAVSYAHSRGVLHRDIKPANVMMGKYGETNVVDWGIARVAGVEDKFAASGEEKPLTATRSGISSKTIDGTAIGTPAYMSPEQAGGRLDKLGPHTDVYCLGATLYAILIGEAPFQGDSTTVLSRVVNGEFPPPSEIKSDVPKPLEAITVKAMSLKPGNRYETPLEMAADVEAWLADEPVAAFAEPASYRLRRWMRNHPATVGGVAAAILVLLAASTIATFMLKSKNSELTTASDTIRKQNQELIEANDKEARQRERADRVKDYLVNIFEKTDPTKDGRALTLAELLDSSVKKIDDDLRDDPLMQAELYAALGTSYVGLGLYKESLASFEKELAIRKVRQNENDAQRLRASQNVGLALWRLSEYDDALTRLLPTLERQEEVFGKKNLDVMNSMNLVGLCYQAQGKIKEATAIFKELVELRKDVHGVDASETLVAINNLASAYSRATRYEDALKLYQANLEKRRKLHGENHLKTLQAKASYASTLRLMGQYKKATEIYKNVVEKRTAELGETHPDTLSAKSSLVLALQDDGQYAQVVPYMREVLAANREKLGDNHTETFRSMNTLAMTLVRTGKYPDAIDLFDELLPRYETKYGKDNSSTISVVNNLAYSYLSNGQYKKAMPLFERAYETRSENLGENHDKTIISHNNWALAIKSSGDLATALPMLKKSYEAWVEKAGEDRPNTLSSARMLGTALREAGEYEKSLAILQPTRKKQIELLTDRHPNTLYSAVSLAQTLNKLKQTDAAQEMIDDAADILAERFGEDHPQTISADFAQARIMADADKSPAALKILLSALERSRETLGAEHPRTASIMAVTATVYSMTDQVEAADQFFDKALKMQIRKLGEKHPKTLETKLDLAQHMLQQKRFDDAEKVLSQLWKDLPTAADRNLLPIENERRKRVIQFHVDLYEALGKPQQKEIWLKKK